MQIKVEYKIPEGINRAIDDKITKAFESVGINWYAQGFDIQSGVRDICFDIDDTIEIATACGLDGTN